MNKSTVTAAEVRAYFRADAKRIQALSDEAAVTVTEGAKGRLHPEAIDLHNKRRRTRQYTVGASKAAALASQTEARAMREAAAAAGITVGKRGPLPKAAVSLIKG